MFVTILLTPSLLHYPSQEGEWVKLRNLSTKRCSFCPVTSFAYTSAILLPLYLALSLPQTISHVVQAGRQQFLT
jgi:hypothetical protein